MVYASAASPAAPVRSWTTAGLSGLDRIDQWNAVASAAFTPLSISPLGEQFSAGLRIVEVGDLGIATVDSRPSHVEHARVHVAAGSTDPFFLIHLQTRGSSVNRQAGRVVTLEAGDLTIVNSTRPYDLVFGGDAGFIVCRVPAAKVLSRLPAAQDNVVVRLPAAATGSRLLRNCIEAVWQEVLSQSCDADLELDEIVLENLRFAISQQMRADRGDECGESRFRRAVAAIEHNIREPELDVAAVAAKLGISERCLQKDFAARGKTPSAFIRTMRVRRAMDAIIGDRSITEVAFEWGFRDLNQFGRAFRQETGFSPREYRQRNR